MEATKRGDWYTVKGEVAGKRVSADIPAPYIDGKSRKAADEVMKRALQQVAQAG